MSELRGREDDRRIASSRVIGASSIWNHKTGNMATTGNVSTSCSDGIYRLTFDELHKGPPFMTGGPLFAYRLLQPNYMVSAGSTIVGRTLPAGTYGSNPSVVVKSGDDFRYHYDGGFVKSLTSLPSNQRDLGLSEHITRARETGSFVNPDDMSSLGNVAYNKLRPKVENASLLQDVIEARDIPGMLKTTSQGFSSLWKATGGNFPHGSTRGRSLALREWKQSPKSAADQFLNGAFGWRPFVKSIVSVCDTLLFAADHIASRERNNGRWLKRRFAEEELVSESLLYGQYGVTSSLATPVLGINQIAPFSGSFEIRRQTYSRVWYEGSFKYYRPEFDRGLKTEYPTLRTVRQMATLLGANLNATTLYKVTPWTWLADWFVNVGGNIQALEDLATNQVASRYMYLMRSTFDQFEYKVVFSDYSGKTFELVWYKSAALKRREPAVSPFGFALLPGGLSPMQYAIMAALGISRM